MPKKENAAYILVDRSGSMAGNWNETLGAVNGYVEKLGSQPETKDVRVSLYFFDSVEPFECATLKTKAKKYLPVTEGNYMPRGLTPLHDAVGRLSSEIAEDKPKLASIVIVTDGAENDSKEFTLMQSRDFVKKWIKKGYDVIFLGADFNAMAQGQSLGQNKNAILNMRSGHYAEAMMTVATRSTQVFTGASASTMAFSDEDRKRASS